MFIGVYSLSVLFSYIAIILSFGACYFALNDNIKITLILYLLVGLIDVLDGKFAGLFKRNDFEKKYGVQIDTVLDVVNYSAVPIVILCFLGFKELIDIILYIIYVFCVTTRLAYFNTLVEEDNKVFYGVPSTMIVFGLPVMLIIYTLTNSIWIFRLLLLVMSLSFIINIKIKKSRSLKFFLMMGICGLLLIWGILYLL